MSAASSAVGIDLGGTNARVALVTADGEGRTASPRSS